MPEAVQTYLDSSYDMGGVREVASQVVEQYRFDISKYAQGRAPQVRAIYDAVPSQLDKENKRFRMDALKDGAAFARYQNDFAWLIDAGVVLPTYAAAEPKSPLLLRDAWGWEYLIKTKTVGTHIKRLRDKISGAGYDSGLVETVCGYGYRFRA